MTARLHILTTVPEGPLGYFRRDAERLERLLSVAAPGALQIEPDHRRADTVLFVGARHRSLLDVRASAVYRADPRKCLAIHSGDDPLPTVPGIYASVPRHWYRRSVHRAGFYLRTAVDATIPCFAQETPRHVFSFVGAGGHHPVRQSILALHSADALLIDSARHPLPQEHATARFVDSLRSSLFVLCPRGGGTSSFRIFETMMAGRVPVIVSDDWVEPEGPDWSTFSLRVAQRDVTRLPALLADLQGQGLAMGQCARAAWEAWFSPQTAGATLLGWIRELRRSTEAMDPQRLPAALAWRAAADAVRSGLGRAWRSAAGQGAAPS